MDGGKGMRDFFPLFIYVWLHWVFVAACRLSLSVTDGGDSACGARTSHCGGFSYCKVWAQRLWPSGLVGEPCF